MITNRPKQNNQQQINGNKNNIENKTKTKKKIQFQCFMIPTSSDKSTQNNNKKYIEFIVIYWYKGHCRRTR